MPGLTLSTLLDNGRGPPLPDAAEEVRDRKHSSALSLVCFLETKTAGDVEMQWKKFSWSGQKIQNYE